MDDKQEQAVLILIDPPVSAYSSPDEIRQWIRELESMPQVPYVQESLEEARCWLNQAVRRSW